MPLAAPVMRATFPLSFMMITPELTAVHNRPMPAMPSGRFSMHHAGRCRSREGVSVIRRALHSSNDREELPVLAAVIVSKSIKMHVS
jgi:hypothetical protein